MGSLGLITRSCSSDFVMSMSFVASEVASGTAEETGISEVTGNSSVLGCSVGVGSTSNARSSGSANSELPALVSAGCPASTGASVLTCSLAGVAGSSAIKSSSPAFAFFDFFLSFLLFLVEIEPQASASSGNASVAGGVVGSRAFSGEISAVAGVGS